MDNAMDRARRRSDGAQSRVFDPDVDRIAQFRIDLRDGARQTKADDRASKFDWSGIWAVPPSRLVEPPRHQLARIQHTVWEITLTNS
jgi:hypothetical protein